MISRRLILALAIGAVLLGIVARLDSLDRKVLWRDESFSLLRISGHSENALYALFDGKVHSSSEMLALQAVTPPVGLRATLASLSEEPQRGPLYYVLGRLWIGISGNATAAVRGLSVLLGLLGVGIGFLLGRRLTGTTGGGAVLAGLIALSPIEIRYSQQVREYALVADLTLLSAFLLLRALERPSALRWFWFASCLVAGLYTNVTFACAIVSETLAALFIAGSDGVRRRAIARGSVAAALGAASFYAPWAYAVSRTAAQHAGDLGWAVGAYSLRSTAMKWAFNSGAVFFDSEYAHRSWAAVLVPILCIVSLAVARAFVTKERATARVVALAVTFSTLVPLVGLDALHHAHYALVARYQMATWLGLPMLVTLLIASRRATVSTLSGSLALAALCLLIAAGSTSVFVDRAFTQWWDNNDRLSESAVAEVVRSGPQPALVVARIDDNNAYDTFVLSRYLPEHTPMLLLGERQGALPPDYGAIYLFTPSRSELARAGTREHLAERNVSPLSEFPAPEIDRTRSGNSETVATGNALWDLRPSPRDAHI